MLSEAELSAYREQGFVKVGPIFSSDELALIAREYDRLVTFEGQTLGSEADGVYPYRAMLNFRSDALKPFINHPEVVGRMIDLLGPDVRFWWDQGINKAPGSGSFIPWHQDNGYQAGRAPEYVTLWLALDDSTLENGGLEVIPGSHRDGQRRHQMQGVHAVVSDVDETRAIALDVRAGEVVIFSTLLLHRTVGNTTPDRQRRAWVLQYGRGDAQNEMTGEIYDNRPWVAKGGERVAKPYSERAFRFRDHV
ncbi:MAG: phytanoyl-CoA dioxygenase family protein [Myxococcota bacterium]